MPISRLTAHHVRIPLKRTVRHASHSRSATDSIIVRCELDDGSVGWGEGLPRAYVTGETIDDAWQLLQSVDFAGPLGGDLSDPGAAVAALDALQIAPPQLSTLNPQLSTSHVARGCYGNSVRCAIELAVLDAVCRREGQPLSRLTELVPETASIRQQSGEARYSGIITAERPFAQVRSALKQRLYGFRAIKVKVGVPGVDDVSLLRRVRRIIGPRVDLRIDANEAWSCHELVGRLAQLQPFRISCVEQPVPHAETAGLAKLRGEIGVPVMLDESLCSAQDAQRVITARLCDLFNIRLSKCGGFIPSLRLAALAHSAGLGCQLGCQVGETGILSAAGRHFATSVAGLRYVEGSYDRHLVRERLTREDLTFGYGGRAPALTGPGLGITVDADAVEHVTVRHVDLIRT